MASTTTTIRYLLPVTRVRLQAIVQTITDTVLGDEKSATTSFVFSLVTAADPARPRTLSVRNGPLSDYSFEIGLTEDGRLTGAGVGSTGQLGTVLAAGVTVAVAAAGVLAGNLPALAGAAAAVAGTVKRREGVLGGPPEQKSVKPAEPADPVWAKYREQHPASADRLHHLLTERDATVQALDLARKELRTAAGDSAARDSKQQEVNILKELLTDLDADLDKATTQFNAWREGTLTTTIRSYDELLPLSQLPFYENGTPNFGTAPNAASEFYAATGRILATVGYDRAAVADQAAQQQAAQQTATTTLHVLRPRPVALVHFERADGDDKPHVTGYDRVLVMDAGSEELTVPVRKSLWAKRRTDLSLSELGAMTKVSYNGTSNASASQTLAGVPEKVSGAMEQAAKINSELDRAGTSH